MPWGCRTFCSEVAKWLCQNSVMRSASGVGDSRISTSHQVDSARVSARSRTLASRRAASSGSWPYGTCTGSAVNAGAGCRGVTASACASNRSTAAAGVMPTHGATSAGDGANPVRASKWRASASDRRSGTCAPATSSSIASQQPARNRTEIMDA